MSQKLGPLHLRLVASPLPQGITKDQHPAYLRQRTVVLPPIAPKAPQQRPHIIVLALEGARQDYVDVMPAVGTIAQQGFAAEAHFAAGTTTRYAIFSAFYGLSGMYWEPVERASQAPPLLTHLHQHGYRSRIYAATQQTNPPFTRTCFLEAQMLHDRWDDVALGGRSYRHRAMTDRIVSDIDTLHDQSPLFIYALYDASHFPYLYPPEFAINEQATALEAVDLVSTVRDQDLAAVAGLAARYENSLRYLDHEIGRIYAKLQELQQLDNTLLLVLGDHGESFADNGFAGGQVLHNGRFEASQLHTLMAGHIPGRPAGERFVHQTGHADIPATILSVLHKADVDYGHGSPLWHSNGARLVTAANYDELCLLAGDYWLRLGTLPATRDRFVIADPSGTPRAHAGPWQASRIQAALTALALPQPKALP